MVMESDDVIFTRKCRPSLILHLGFLDFPQTSENDQNEKKNTKVM